jgi:hypothetical protein
MSWIEKLKQKKIIKDYGKAKIITATNVFAHIDNINQILKSIIKTLTHFFSIIKELDFF